MLNLRAIPKKALRKLKSGAKRAEGLLCQFGVTSKPAFRTGGVA